jgi:hypothetical protein
MCPPTTYSGGISDSQGEMVRKQLRYQMPLGSDWIAKINPPVGVTLNSDRMYLGQWDARRQGVWLDFDGDARRDIAVWDPPSSLDMTGQHPVLGTFRAYTSRSNFNTAWAVNFGILGDVPMVNDFNGDGCTDIGVRRTSGSNGLQQTVNTAYFVYCPSTGAPNCGTPNCANPVTVTYGFRTDMPSPNPRFHGAPGEVAVFRPGNGTFYWRKYVAGGANGGFQGSDSTVSFGTRFLAAPLSYSDFDADGKTDPTLWNPDSKTFEIKRSSAAYALWTRQFAQSPGMPLEAVGVFTASRPSLYQSGSWATMWDVATPGPVTTCAVGGNDDWPITGIDRDGDARTDMVLFNGDNSGNVGKITFKDSHGGDCNGVVSKTISNSGWATPGMRVFGSFDMTGDNKNDIVLINPRSMEFDWLTSESDYSTILTRFLGTQRSVPL